MEKIKNPGSNRARQDAFLDLLRAGHAAAAACREVDVHPTLFYNAAKADPDFEARWDAAKTIKVQYRKPEQAWTNDTGEAFLNAMVEHGSAAAAARAIGVVLSTAYKVRNRDMDFNAAWYAARRQIAEMIDDRLMEGALHGYAEVVTVDGREVRSTRRANPRMMLKLVERIEADRRSSGGRFVEITPEKVAQARATLMRRLIDGGSLTTMADALDFATGKRTPAEVFLPDGWPQPGEAAPAETEPEIEDAAPGRSLFD